MITYILIVITVLVSLAGFQQQDVINKAIFYPVVMRERNEWWRFITAGFIHGNIPHLAFNMITLYFFGRMVEPLFHELYGSPLVYPFFYIAALVVSSIPSYIKHKDNSYYSALGASGAVSAVLFTTILIDPWMTLRLQFFIPIPAIVFGVGYLVYSNYMSKRGDDHIGHDAHLWGAIFGLLFPLVSRPFLLSHFLEQLKNPRFLS